MALIACAVLSGGFTPAPVSASMTLSDYLLGHSYVGYTEDYVTSPTGVIQELGATATDNDGHVWDLYGNQIIFNSDGSISDGNSQVVGFVYEGTAGPGQP